MGKNEPYKWTSSLSGSGSVEGCQFFSSTLTLALRLCKSYRIIFVTHPYLYFILCFLTRYPLLLNRIRRATPRWHEDRENLKLAQRKVEEQIAKLNSVIIWTIYCQDLFKVLVLCTRMRMRFFVNIHTLPQRKSTYTIFRQLAQSSEHYAVTSVWM